MAANDYYNQPSSGQYGRPLNYDAPLPPLPTSSPLYSSQKPSFPPSPYESPDSASRPHRSQTSFGSDSAYYGAGRGGRVQEPTAYADNIPLRSHAQNNRSDEWTGQTQQPYSPDEAERPSDSGRGGRRSRSKAKRRKGFFSGKIPWVVYILTLAQITVFIAELVKNCKLPRFGL